jgi:Ca-activated chloride channel family protein
MKNNRHISYSFNLGVFPLLLFIFLFPFISNAQKEKKFILDGNKNYAEKKYDVAEKNYKQALGKNKNSYQSNFNLGDAYYQQGKYDQATEQFQALTHRATSKDTLSKAYHNLGNSLLKSKKYKESVDAYKNALKNNPNDEDTRYNLACAQQYLKQQQQQQNKDKKDDQKKNEDKKDKKDDQKKNDQKKNEKKEQQKQEEQKNQISKENAQRLLDALQNDEKNLHDKAKKAKVQGVKVQIEKDW